MAADLHLARSAPTLAYDHDGHHFVGARGILLIGALLWHTIEIVRKDGQPYVSLRPGLYTVEMARMAVGRRALRILPDGLDPNGYPSAATFRAIERGRMYLHGANVLILRPHHLAGCVGAGVEVADLGVRASTRAMFEIFDALGGFEAGQRFSLEVAAA